MVRNDTENREMGLFSNLVFSFICFIVLNLCLYISIKFPHGCTHSDQSRREYNSVYCTTPTVQYRYDSKQLRDMRWRGVGMYRPDQTLLLDLNDIGILQYRGKRAGKVKHRQSRGVNFSNLRSIQCTDKTSPHTNDGILPTKSSVSLSSNSTHRKLINIATLNAQSLRNKSADVIQHMIDERIDICVITETWLNENGDDKTIAEITQQGFCFDSIPRLDRNGGGIALLYRDNISVNKATLNHFESFEYAEWKITTKSCNLVVVGLYRPPYSEKHRVTQSQFLHEFPSLLEKLSMCNEPILILGDINFHCEIKDDVYTKQLLSQLKSFNMKQIVDTPTHNSGHTLDVIITRCNETIDITNVQSDYYASDHCFVSCTINKLRPELTSKTVSFRKWKSLNESEFTRDVDNQLIQNNHTDVDSLVSNFSRIISNIIDKHVPTKSRTIVSRPTVPWYTEYLREFKRIRRKVESIHLKFKNDISKTIYNKIKSRYSAAVSYAKSQFYHTKIQEAENNTKYLYDAISGLTGRTKQNPLPPSTDDTTLANDFLKYFSNKIETIRNDLDNVQNNNTLYIQDSKSVAVETFDQFKPLEQSDVRRLILGSKSTTCELDVIPTPKLKIYLEHFLPSLTNIFNSSLSSGSFPKEWKTALVRPLLKKKGLEPILKNYRPVSNLSFLSKILEKAALEQIVSHVEDNNLLPDYQSAYRKNRGVETSLMKMYDDIITAADNKLVSIVVMIDLSAAFDTVDIPILLSMLKTKFNIDGAPLNWLKSYLSERTMNVIINGKLSEEKPLKYGVPQGSCAGPVVFTLYIAALNLVVQQCCPDIILYGYADDHKLAITCNAGNIHSEAEAKRNIENCLKYIVTWMADHKLKMNNDKTEVIVYGTKQQLNKLTIKSINVDGTEIKCVTSVRDLGVTFTSNFDFESHIKKKCQIASYHLQNLKSIRQYLSKKATEILVHGLVNSQLDFCNSLFFGIPQYQLNRLQSIQNRAARIIFNVGYDHSAEPLLRSLHWLPVRARIEYKLITVVYKCLNKSAPVYLQNLLEYQNISRQLRSSNKHFLKVPRVNTKLGERSFRVAGPRLWNTLPVGLRTIASEERFRRDLKTFLFKKFYH